MTAAKFITIEGVEGVGKSTARDFIQNVLDEANIAYVSTREPGGTPIAEEIREVLLKQHNEIMSPHTELLLMFAGRAQNISHVIHPALQRGQWVISDRFTDASFAYQGSGRGVPLEEIRELEQWVQGDLQPDLTILLDAPVEVGMARIQKRNTKDRIEQEGIDFFKRVRERYLIRAKKFPSRFCVINAEQPLAQVQEEIKKAVMALMGEQQHV